MSDRKDIVDADLQEALDELSKVEKEARKEGYNPPLRIALGNAGQLLMEMYQYSPRRYVVYPTQKGEVAVGAQNRPRGGILLLCNSLGGVKFSVSLDGDSRHMTYEDASSLPDNFMYEALDELTTPR